MEKNRYNLSRYIPAPTRREIRKRAGYGCVICGNAIITYEHVDPEFKDCKAHDADKMTLLCWSHQGKKTNRILSVEAVKEAMKNPWAFQHGMSHDDLELPAGPSEIHIGSSVYRDVKAIISVNDRPVVWFEPPESRGGPARLNCFFCDENGNLIAKIENNQFKSSRTSCDVTMIGTKITIKDTESKRNMLVFERVGGEAVRIHELNMVIDGAVFAVKGGVMTAIIGGSTTTVSNFNFQGGGGSVFSFHIKGFHTDPGYFEFKDWVGKNSFAIPIPTAEGGFCHSLDGIQYLTKKMLPARIVEVDASTKLEDRYLIADVAEVTIFLCKSKAAGSEFYKKIFLECNNVTVVTGEPITFIVLSVENGINKHGHICFNQIQPSEYTIETDDPKLLELFQNVKLKK